MNNAASLLIAVGVALGLLVSVWVLYYLGSIAANLYETRVAMRQETEKQIRELKEHLDKELQQRTVWIRGEIGNTVRDARAEIDAEQVALRQEVQEAIAGLRKQLAYLESATGTDISGLDEAGTDKAKNEKAKKKS